MIAMSVITKKTLLRAIYLIATGFGFAALMTADSDSGILGMAVFMIIYLVWFSNSLVRLKRFSFRQLLCCCLQSCSDCSRSALTTKARALISFRKFSFSQASAGYCLQLVPLLQGFCILLITKTKHHNFKSRADCSCRCIRTLCCCHDWNYGLFQLC